MSAPRTLTVGQLIAVLQEFPAEMPVMRSSPSGDYWGRILALPVDKYDTDVFRIRWSEYHRQWRMPSDREEMGEDEEGNPLAEESFEEGKEPFDALLIG